MICTHHLSPETAEHPARHDLKCRRWIDVFNDQLLSGFLTIRSLNRFHRTPISDVRPSRIFWNLAIHHAPSTIRHLSGKPLQFPSQIHAKNLPNSLKT